MREIMFEILYHVLNANVSSFTKKSNLIYLIEQEMTKSISVVALVSPPFLKILNSKVVC